MPAYLIPAASIFPSLFSSRAPSSSTDPRMAVPLRLCARLRRLPLTLPPSLFLARTPQISCWTAPARAAHVARGLRLRGAPYAEDEEEKEDGEREETKSRNARKREAQRAVRWGMDLAEFAPPHIKRILSVVSVDQELVYEALMLVKRLGPDVKEGKRRQFNYIGKLLRDAQPELMDSLIQASKDHDQNKLQSLMGQDARSDEEEEIDSEEECGNFVTAASRWFDGLINKDSFITKEVYSLHNIEFDRQELRKLVQKVQEIKESGAKQDNGAEDVASTIAKKSLMRFLCRLAKQSLSEE